MHEPWHSLLSAEHQPLLTLPPPLKNSEFSCLVTYISGSHSATRRHRFHLTNEVKLTKPSSSPNSQTYRTPSPQIHDELTVGATQSHSVDSIPDSETSDKRSTDSDRSDTTSSSNLRPCSTTLVPRHLPPLSWFRMHSRTKTFRISVFCPYIPPVPTALSHVSTSWSFTQRASTSEVSVERVVQRMDAVANGN
jgi:hypothetical protein